MCGCGHDLSHNLNAELHRISDFGPVTRDLVTLRMRRLLSLQEGSAPLG
jgi:hypothetical protein